MLTITDYDNIQTTPIDSNNSVDYEGLLNWYLNTHLSTAVAWSEKKSSCILSFTNILFWY